MVARGIVAVLAVAALAFTFYAASASAATATPVIRSQGPCVEAGQEYCRHFDTSDFGSAPVTLRHLRFRVPSAGRASVTFTGSLDCGNVQSPDIAIELDSQIVGTGSAAPVASGPGGLRHHVVLSGFLNATFSLASTRVFDYASGGEKHVYLRLAGGIPLGTYCNAFDAAFSVVFVP
jgi:hypothetical protein